MYYFYKHAHETIIIIIKIECWWGKKNGNLIALWEKKLDRGSSSAYLGIDSLVFLHEPSIKIEMTEK